MYNTIFTISLVVLLLLFVGLGLLKSKRYVWYYALSRVLSAIVSAVSSFFLAGVVTDLIADIGYDILIEKLPENVSGTLKDIASAPDLFSALVTVILAPIFFVILFLIVKAVLNCIAKNICIAVGKSQARKTAAAIETVVTESAEAETAETAEAAEVETAETVAAFATATATDTVAEAAAEGSETAETADAIAEPAEATDSEACEPAETEGKKAKKAKKEKKPKKPKKIKRISYVKTPKVNAVGMISGAFCGLVIFFVIMVPFVGTATIADEVMELVASVLEQDTVNTVNEVTDAAANNPISKAVGAVGGRAVFDGLTTSNVGGHDVSLNKEIHLLTTTGNAVLATVNNDVPRDEAAASIREVSAAFSDSDLIPTVVPEVLVAANASWEKGEDFHGIKKISASGKAQTVVDPLVDILVTSDYDSLKADADTIVEILAILVEQDAINAVIKDPAGIPENEEMTAPVLYELLENEHFTSVVNSLAELGVQYIGEQLHLHARRDTLYAEFTEEAAANVSAVIATGFTDPTEKMTEIYTELFDDYGLAVSADSAAAIAQKTVETFPEGAVTVEAMKAFLADTELTLNDTRVIKLDSADALLDNSLLVCVDDISFNVEAVSDTGAESKALARAVHEVFSLTALIKNGDFSDASSIQKLGPILDALSSTETMGSENTGHLLTGILQSDMVHDQIGFSLVSATDVASTIFASSEKQGYAPLLKSLSDTVEVVQLTTSETATKEEINTKVETLLNELTPESAEVLQKISSPEVMVNQGVPEQSAKPVSDLVSNVFGNLSTAKENGMSDEEYKREAEATSTLLNMALAATANDKNVFGDDEISDSTEGGTEGGTEGDTTTPAPAPSTNSMTADEYIDNVMNSTVVSKTIVDTVFTEDSGDAPVMDPMNMGKSLSEKEQANVLTSLNEHWASATEEEKNDPEYFKTYAAIGAMVNFPVEVGADGTIIAATTEA